MRRHHPGLFVAATTLGIGLIALTLIPGAPRVAEADESAASVISIASPNPDLLRHLDFEVSPPPVQAQPVKVAAIQPERIMPSAAGLAAPAAAGIMATPPDSGSVGPIAVNLRSGPSTGSATLAVLDAGQPVKTGQTSGGWIQVTLADGTSGWVYGSYLAGNVPTSTTTAKSGPENSDAPAPRRVATAPKPRAVIHGDASDLEDRTARIASRLAAFSKPLDSAPSIFTLQPGDQVRIAQVSGDWLKVETPDGLAGWIHRAN